MRSVADPRQFPPEECEAAQWVRRPVRRARLRRRAARANCRTAAEPCVGSRPAPIRMPRRCCSTRTTTCSRPSTRPPGARPVRAHRGRRALVRTRCRRLQGQHRHAPARATGTRRRRAGEPEARRRGLGGTGHGRARGVRPGHPDLLRADTILVCDTGNAAVGRPGRDRDPAGHGQCRGHRERSASECTPACSAGAAPDALAALIAMLATLRDERGQHHVAGSTTTQTWRGEPYPAEQFRADAGVLDGVELIGDGTVSDMLWARPAVTVLGIDCPPVIGRRRRSCRAPPPGSTCGSRRVSTPRGSRRPCGALARRRTVGRARRRRTEAVGAPFEASDDGPAFRAMGAAMLEAYGRPVTTSGKAGRSRCATCCRHVSGRGDHPHGRGRAARLIHAPNESVDPSEIERLALSLAILLRGYGTGVRGL